MRLQPDKEDIALLRQVIEVELDAFAEFLTLALARRALSGVLSCDIWFALVEEYLAGLSAACL
jgi:hypothetical protein